MKPIIAIIIGITLGVLIAEYDTYLKIQDKVYYDYYTCQDNPPANLFSWIGQFKTSD